MEFNVNSFTVIIAILIMISIFTSNFIKGSSGEKTFKEYYAMGATGILFTLVLVSLTYREKTSVLLKSNFIHLFSLGIFTIASIGYTIYEWDTIKKDSECGILVPSSDRYNSGDYYVYRLLYLTTIIALIVILQFKIDDEKLAGKYNLHKLIFLMPILFPILTETVSYITNLFSDNKTNPESLLLNFIKGDASAEWGKQWARSLMPFLFYTVLMIVAILCGMGKIGSRPGYVGIYIITVFLIFFSAIMKTIFVQDCSLDKDIAKKEGEKGQTELSCVFEKYGGIQNMLNVVLLIIIIYHINDPTYKLLFFIIIVLGSWGLSTTYILNFNGKS